MKNIFRSGIRPALLGWFVTVALSLACASHSVPLMVGIKTTADTVALQHNLDDTFFTTTAVVHNRDSRPVALVGCYPAAERNIDGQWTMVFLPGCIADAFVPIAPGDSAMVPVALWGYTAEGKWPKLDPRAQPGNYRLVFFVKLVHSYDTPASPSGSEEVRSAVFVLQ
jgi:hypothetical protein